jgi:hypothetical protein
MRTSLAFVLALLWFVPSGCDPAYRASNQNEATAGVVGKGIFDPVPKSFDGGKSSGQLGGIWVTHFVAAKGCEGNVGSVIPPLSINCGLRAVFKPLQSLGSLMEGQAPSRTIALIGLEQFWVYQGDTELCWAAALETARAYLHLKRIPFNQVRGVMSKECPMFAAGTDRAQAYQILYTAGSLSYHRDGYDEPEYFCSTEPCIVGAIQHNRPVMVLRKSHAVLIQALEIEYGTTDLIHKYHILDPADKYKQIKIVDPLEMCDVDAFLVL